MSEYFCQIKELPYIHFYWNETFNNYLMVEANLILPIIKTAMQKKIVNWGVK